LLRKLQKAVLYVKSRSGKVVSNVSFLSLKESVISHCVSNIANPVMHFKCLLDLEVILRVTVPTACYGENVSTVDQLTLNQSLHN